MIRLADDAVRLGALVSPAPGVWRAPSFAGAGLVHGFGERSLTAEALIERLGVGSAAVIRLEQVHGGAIAGITQPLRIERALLSGYDGAVTDVPDVALTIRTADCAPV